MLCLEKTKISIWVSLWKLYKTDPTDPAWSSACHYNIKHQRKRNREKSEGVNPADKTPSVIPSSHLPLLCTIRGFSPRFLWALGVTGTPQGPCSWVWPFSILTLNCSCSGVQGSCGVFHEEPSHFISVCVSPCLHFCFSCCRDVSPSNNDNNMRLFLNLQELDFSGSRVPAIPWRSWWETILCRNVFCVLDARPPLGSKEFKSQSYYSLY